MRQACKNFTLNRSENIEKFFKIFLKSMLSYVNLGVEYEKNKKKTIRISFPVQKLQKFKKNSKFSKIEFSTLDPPKFLKVKIKK